MSISHYYGDFSIIYHLTNRNSSLYAAVSNRDINALRKFLNRNDIKTELLSILMCQTTIKEMAEVTRTSGKPRFFIFADPKEYKPLTNIDDLFLESEPKSESEGVTIFPDSMPLYAVDDPSEIGELEQKAKELGIKKSKVVYDSSMFLDYAFLQVA